MIHLNVSALSRICSRMLTQCNLHTESLKKEKNMIISGDAEKAFDKIKHLFIFILYFGHDTWLAESWFPDQGLNPSPQQ